MRVFLYLCHDLCPPVPEIQPRTMDKLPQELIDKIIGSFDRTIPSGYSTLLTCSLVSRSWRQQAQRGLFSSSSISLGIDSLKRFDNDIPLQSKIPSYIHYLGWYIWPAAKGQPDPFLEAAFPGRFTSFSNIGALELSELPLSSLATTDIERIFGHISHSLRGLDISHLVTNPEKLCFFVSILPNLQYMYTPFVSMLEEEGGSGPTHPMSFDFNGHLAPFGPATKQLFRCVAGLRPRFETLEVMIVNDMMLDTFNLVVQSCSATLTTISISPPLHGIMEGNSKLVQLVHR